MEKIIMEEINNRSLSLQATKDFQQIFKKEFGKEISYEEAQEQGGKLLRLFSLLYPISKRWLPENRKEKNNGK